MSEPSLELGVDEALMMITGRLRGSDAYQAKVQVSLTPTDLRTGAFLVCNAIPPEIPFMFHRRPSLEARKKLLLVPAKAEGSANEVLKPVHIQYDTSSIQPPAPLPQDQRRKLFDKFKESMPPDRPHMITLQAPPLEGNLPSLHATLTVSGFAAEDNDPSDTLTDFPLLYDPGATATVISDELLSPSFQQYLTSEANQPYMISHLYVQVSLRICFTNTVTKLETVAIVRPRNAMPNKFNGIILGQKGAIDCLVTKMVPRNFLKDLPEKFWGEIQISKAYDYLTEEITEYRNV